MQINGSQDSILQHYIGATEGRVIEALDRARELVQQTKREIYSYQAAALFAMAEQFNQTGAQILELGTAYGYSCAMIALAAPKARIVTLNPTTHEAEAARKALRGFPNVEVVEMKSWDYLPFASVQLSMVFVDADHKRVIHDLPYWNHLATGGLMIHHDYSPLESSRACPPVFETLNKFAQWLGREPDELVVDDMLVGMAGWYYQANDPVFSPGVLVSSVETD